MSSSTRSGNNSRRDIQIQSSNHSIEKCSDSTKPAIQLYSVARKKGNGKIDEISDDILSEGIFTKLPLTSLCTCKCVSKLWNSLIMQNYHQLKRLPIICRIGLSTNPLRLCSVDSNTGAVTPIYTPIDFGTRTRPICSNGFICFDNPLNRQNSVVFNPATKEKNLVPNSPNEYYTHYFGFDPCSNKFKLLRGKFLGSVRYPRCEVYTLGTGSWRKVNNTPIQGSGKCCSMLYCLNGIIYWYSDTGMINFFQLGTEIFGVFRGPNSEIPIKKVDHMFDLEGCLCLAVLRVKPDKIMDLWMLRGQYNVNSGWVLMASVTKPQGTKISWNCPYLTRTDELLLAKCEKQGSQGFYLYSLLNKQFRNIKICGQDSYYTLNNFKENLARLEDF